MMASVQVDLDQHELEAHLNALKSLSYHALHSHESGEEIDLSVQPVERMV